MILRSLWIALGLQSQSLVNADDLIKPPRILHVGHDEALEVRTRQRREQAEKVRRAAKLIETTDRIPLRRVK